jgi:hypothetical protein
LIADAHATVRAVVEQPTFPYSPNNHQTPWTFLAPRIGGRGKNETFGGGPLRIVNLALAVAVGWWARRWRERPAMLVWAAVLALGLRCFTETVMTPYYCWAPLAVGLVVAARCSRARFTLAIVLAVVTTVIAQWHLELFWWWALDVAGVAAVLLLAFRPGPAPETLRPDRAPKPRPRGGKNSARRKPAPSARKRVAR